MDVDRDHSEPCVHYAQKLDLTLKHHIDDFDLTGPDQAMNDLLGCTDSKMLLEEGPKEYPGQ
eukprot:645885-Alexandrium_andersonii.AAC.1